MPSVPPAAYEPGREPGRRKAGLAHLGQPRGSLVAAVAHRGAVDDRRKAPRAGARCCASASPPRRCPHPGQCPRRTARGSLLTAVEQNAPIGMNIGMALEVVVGQHRQRHVGPARVERRREARQQPEARHARDTRSSRCRSATRKRQQHEHPAQKCRARRRGSCPSFSARPRRRSAPPRHRPIQAQRRSGSAAAVTLRRPRRREPHQPEQAQVAGGLRSPAAAEAWPTPSRPAAAGSGQSAPWRGGRCGAGPRWRSVPQQVHATCGCRAAASSAMPQNTAIACGCRDRSNQSGSAGPQRSAAGSYRCRWSANARWPAGNAAGHGLEQRELTLHAARGCRQ